MLLLGNEIDLFYGSDAVQWGTDYTACPANNIRAIDAYQMIKVITRLGLLVYPEAGYMVIDVKDVQLILLLFLNNGGVPRLMITYYIRSNAGHDIPYQ